MKGVLQWVKGHYKPLASALLFAALALFLLLGADAPDEIEIAAVYDEQDHTLQVEQTIRYVNRSELELEYSDQYVDQQASAASIKKIKSMAFKVLPGHDGYLLVRDGRVIPEKELDLDIMLPRGCTDGDNGVYHLTVK